MSLGSYLGMVRRMLHEAFGVSGGRWPFHLRIRRESHDHEGHDHVSDAITDGPSRRSVPRRSAVHVPHRLRGGGPDRAAPHGAVSVSALVPEPYEKDVERLSSRGDAGRLPAFVVAVRLGSGIGLWILGELVASASRATF